ncbi:SRPBCC family protein [Planctomicrobium sp. SH661]|uniref:SRPBCC family protein n=1 Tax=Planctomicrobium sp. SH661 TaxID=3448124 RepID=UPI003F5B9396
MYLTPVSQIPPLQPVDFVSESSWQRERQAVFADSWHLVATGSQLQRHGEFVAVELLGIPVVVRNFDGELVALRNVCAHRQSLLATKPSGCSPTLKCPYHGWEYGADGRTRKLPGASNFPKFDHAHYCLDKFPLEKCGDLVFVRLSSEGPTLREWIGERFETLEQWFSTRSHHLAMHRRFDYPANWKIPVENSLESYHIPFVHPNTFHEDPAEANSTHLFYDTGTCFTSPFHPPRLIDWVLDRAEVGVLRFLGQTPTGIYHHHHIFPNLLISHTDTTSFVQMVFPAGAASSFSLVWQYGLGDSNLSFLPRMVSYAWGKFTGALTRTIVTEDISVYPLVQAGSAGAGKAGLLGRCEERLFESQKYVRQKIDAWEQRTQSPVVETCSGGASCRVNTQPSSGDERTT